VALSPQANKEFSVRYWVRELCLPIKEKKNRGSLLSLVLWGCPCSLGLFGVMLVLCCEKWEIYQWCASSEFNYWHTFSAVQHGFCDLWFCAFSLCCSNMTIHNPLSVCSTQTDSVCLIDISKSTKCIYNEKEKVVAIYKLAVDELWQLRQTTKRYQSDST
jgi:hypothetical protein